MKKGRPGQAALQGVSSLFRLGVFRVEHRLGAGRQTRQALQLAGNDDLGGLAVPTFCMASRALSFTTWSLGADSFSSFRESAMACCTFMMA